MSHLICDISIAGETFICAETPTRHPRLASLCLAWLRILPSVSACSHSYGHCQQDAPNNVQLQPSAGLINFFSNIRRRPTRLALTAFSHVPPDCSVRHPTAATDQSVATASHPFIALTTGTGVPARRSGSVCETRNSPPLQPCYSIVTQWREIASHVAPRFPGQPCSPRRPFVFAVIDARLQMARLPTPLLRILALTTRSTGPKRSGIPSFSTPPPSSPAVTHVLPPRCFFRPSIRPRYAACCWMPAPIPDGKAWNERLNA
ncbi:hypothetical protein CPLU01_15453 [Colletotrichum plurivorum]|uniref:Uncharacterized protein n=1 Tax=Colletotrichum plurivorum TaxID=2175906 RepID=A0A8H6JBK6_9PEZI|nr:hypothetical protein CPLU01_15453 [Colletotrichum plurivorum]